MLARTLQRLADRGIQARMRMPDRATLERAAGAAAAARFTPSPAAIDAWRQLHHAAQIASEVGKAWATVQADDSHSAFTIEDGELRGARVEAPTPFRAVLRMHDLTLRFVGEDGAVLASRSLYGTSFDAGMQWARFEAERIAGPPRQQAVPAPDLPPHPLEAGAPFAVESELAAVASLLDGADALLRALDPRPILWPHHFDLAVLLAIGPTRTIGVGLAVPDTVEASGYWYVSPWSAAPPRRSTPLPALTGGRFVERGNGLVMAVLPLDRWCGLADASLRGSTLADFVATALAAGEAHLTSG
jgi:hypothetical protein